LEVNHDYWWRPQIPEELHFIFHEDYSQMMLILPAIAYKVTEGLAIGVGASILYNLKTDLYGPLNLRLNAFDPSRMIFTGSREDIFAGIDLDMRFDFSPVVGIMWKPKDFFHMGVAYRGQHYVHDYGYTDPILRIVLPGVPTYLIPGLAFDANFEFVHYFSPNEIAAGVRLNPFNPLAVSLDVTWMEWSRYMEVERSNHPSPVPGFEDTVVPRVGIECALTRDTTLRFGYYYYPSPVPEQRWETNNLDNDRHVFSIGSDFLYGPIIVSWHFQYHYAVPRKYYKVSPGDLYAPGLELGGYIISTGLNISMGF
jgi:long-subunit fatty acid transport protein